MERTTIAQVNRIIEDINALQPHKERRYSIDRNACGYRLCFERPRDGASSDISVRRASLGEMYNLCFAIRSVLENGRR
ncbi:MAG: hypothetical protein RR235_10040 [Oscillospiraceae bacterium]